MIARTNEELNNLKKSGSILKRILTAVSGEVKPGIKTDYLNSLARRLVFKYGAKPSFEGYRPNNASRPYPCALCVSIGPEVVHGVPSQRILKQGEIVSLDLGISYKGYFTDAALTVPVGKVSDEAMLLIRSARKALKRGIAQAKAGNHIGDIGNAIEQYVESQGFNVVRELVGHGVGMNVHEEPEVPNFGRKGEGEVIVDGLVLALEPMVTMGDWRVKTASDGFTQITADGSLSSHFEHTVVVRGANPIVIT